MSTSKLIIKHPDGEEVDLRVGYWYLIVANFKEKVKVCAIFTRGVAVMCEVMNESGKTFETPASVLHNLTAKSTRPMTQAERLEVLRGGCECLGTEGQWFGVGGYWYEMNRLFIGGVYSEKITKYRCAPDWTVEREFVKEVEG